MLLWACGVLPLQVGKCGAGFLNYLSLEVTIRPPWLQGPVWCWEPVWSGTLLAPREGLGKLVAPSPLRSPEDKCLLIAMATNKPCVVTSLLSLW